MSTQPRNTPVFYVKVGLPGMAAADRIDQSARVLALSYQDEEAKADKLTLTVNNFDLAAFDSPIWMKGNEIEVSWGYAGWMSPPRLCNIKSVKGGTTLSVEAESKEMLLNKIGKVRHWENMRRSEVAARIAEENGYTGDRVFIEDTKESLSQITQARISDYQLLRDMARREGFQFFIDYDGFHFHSRKLDQKPLRKFEYFTDPGRGDIFSWTVENEVGIGRPGAVILYGFDAKTKEPFEVRADNKSVSARTTLGTVLEVFDTESTSSPLRINAYEISLPTTARSRAEAERIARGMYHKAQMNAINLAFVALGDPDVVAKSVIEIDGIGGSLSGKYYVHSVKHDVGDGFKITVKCKRDAKSDAYQLKAGAQKPPKAAGKENTQSSDQSSTELVPQTSRDAETGQYVTRYVEQRRQVSTTQ